MGPASDPSGPGRFERPLPSFTTVQPRAGVRSGPGGTYPGDAVAGTPHLRRLGIRGLAKRAQAAGAPQPRMRQGAARAPLPPLRPPARPTRASAARPWLGAPLRKTRAGAAPRLAARENPRVAARDLQASWARQLDLPSRIWAPDLALRP